MCDAIGLYYLIAKSEAIFIDNVPIVCRESLNYCLLF